MQFCEPRAGYLELKDEIDAAAARVLTSGQYIRGPEVEAFEAEWAAYCGARHCVGVGNGLEALRLALQANGVGPGAEVLVPAHTYIATWLAVSAVGAQPVPYEWGGKDRFSSRTAMVIRVHLYGRPVAIPPIERVLTLEDSAQAHGLKLGGLAAAFSFYPTKNLGGYGDGGAVVTNNAALAAKVRRLANYGSEAKYHNAERGMNSRLDELQAAVLRVKLRHLDGMNARRCVLARRYLEQLADLPIGLPEDHPQHVWHQFVIRVKARDRVQARLAELGVETLIHYPVPPHLQPAYADLGYQRGDFPLTEAMADEVLSLPLWPQMPAGQVDEACDALRRAL